MSSIVLPLLSSTAKAAGAQLSQLFTPQQMHTGTEAAGTRLTVLGPSPALENPDGTRIP